MDKIAKSYFANTIFIKYEKLIFFSLYYINFKFTKFEEEAIDITTIIFQNILLEISSSNSWECSVAFKDYRKNIKII